MASKLDRFPWSSLNESINMSWGSIEIKDLRGYEEIKGVWMQMVECAKIRRHVHTAVWMVRTVRTWAIQNSIRFDLRRRNGWCANIRQIVQTGSSYTRPYKSLEEMVTRVSYLWVFTIPNVGDGDGTSWQPVLAGKEKAKMPHTCGLSHWSDLNGTLLQTWPHMLIQL